MTCKEKTVGRRATSWRVTPAEAAAWQNIVARWHPGRALCDRGVFRFRTFEEADSWRMDQLARKARERRHRKTSGGSRRA